MNQPKTVEEFMALPIKELFSFYEFDVKKDRAEIERHLGAERTAAIVGRTIRIPRVRTSYAMSMDDDTIFTCGEWVLCLDEDGYCRRSVPSY